MLTKHRCVVSSVLVALSLTAGHAGAEILFEDGFESGTRNTTQNGVRWHYSTDNVRPTTDRAYKGRYSLVFPFRGVPSGQDSFEEQRIRFGNQYKELWIKCDVYIPSNYHHRREQGGDNNKFFAIYNNNYQPGFQVNFSLHPRSDGGSNLAIHYYRNGREEPFISNRDALFTPEDFGKWHRIVMHFKVASSTNASDGVQELWKNGRSIMSIKNLANGGPAGLNYMDEAYIWGWANSGFNENTHIYVDDVVISTSPIPLEEDGGTRRTVPNPPTDVRAN